MDLKNLYKKIVSKDSSITNSENLVDIKIKESSETIDGIFGFAIADALGVPAEFKSRSSLKENPITDMIGYGSHNQPEGTWSDDSSMTIATMDSINECQKIDYKDMMKKFSEWERDSKYTATGVFFDIGISTSNAIYQYNRGVDPTKCGGTRINENGNGSLMRILPIVLYLHSQDLPYGESTRIINECSSLTHGHEISKLGCRIYADYINSILDGKSREEALENLSMIDYSNYYSSESIKYYEKIINGTIVDLPENMIKSSGFVVDTLEASIWCAHNTNDYESSVLKAVNLGNDTDTVGAITGSITGLLYGYENIPEKWRNKLKNRKYLMDVCNKFNNTLEKNKNSKKTL